MSITLTGIHLEVLVVGAYLLGLWMESSGYRLQDGRTVDAGSMGCLASWDCLYNLHEGVAPLDCLYGGLCA